MKLLLIISSILVTIAATNAESWFREKYLQKTYDEYYDYSISRYRFGDNNPDICPEIHKSAIFFAITGRPMNRKTVFPTCFPSLYARKLSKIDLQYHPPEAHYVRLVRVTVTDVIEPLGNFMCYLFELCMILLSMIFASFGTLVMIILIFRQY